ncbi:myosin light chain alkali-like isoform X2 [Homalodisca vitripennis]|uniref:myosin light chain alkali-like isoform X1 n=1 Tax=Homalodisca vitripennis TaxID=197043 RepID=UPI001EEC0081|nr:myosin light chain alkali-like isoform X1 [Homalodisca vitripennis]XP_046683911.1 myosin light chain alkali-like isoform X2 [Homalodisca vitripennis]
MAQEDERKRLLFVFDVYSDDGSTIDGADVINALRAFNLNPTMQLVNSLGGSDNRGEVKYSFDDFWKIYLGVRDDKNSGGFSDFVECLKIYDIAENGTMKLVDLTSMLVTLGEKITDAQMNEVLSDCQLEEEDDDGWFPYLPFLCRLCDRPVPASWKP